MHSAPTTVLVVDNDHVFAASLGAVAARRGFASLVVGDADEAVRRFSDRPPAAVVLDVTPGGRGLDTLDRVRQLDHHVPVLAVSAPASHSTVVQAVRSGADDYLCKPVDETELEGAMARLLDERCVRADLRALRAAIVHELEDVVGRLVAFGGAAARDARRARGESTVAPAAPPPAAGSLKAIARAAARQAECAAISRVLQRTRWNRKEAAAFLGISYKALLYKIKENGLDKPSAP